MLARSFSDVSILFATSFAPNFSAAIWIRRPHVEASCLLSLELITGNGCISTLACIFCQSPPPPPIPRAMSIDNTLVIVDDTDPRVQWNGPWFTTRDYSSEGWNGAPFLNTLHGISSNGSLTFNFQGSSIPHTNVLRMPLKVSTREMGGPLGIADAA